MKRALVPVVLSLLLLATSIAAQTPKVSVEFDEVETVVGQPLTLRIKILVPTWMPKPPVFPTLEMPSLMVRLPERASGPVSEKVDGETWSGVQRAYRLYPLQAGRFVLPKGEIGVTYAELGKTDPLNKVIPLPEITFVATVPAAARDLSPLILAEALTLEQEIEGETKLAAGDAITRTITASISGTTPVMIPRLHAESETPGLRAYPKEPKVTETENRGVLSGTRTEVITYVAQDGGSMTLPEISIEWFNLKSGAVETAQAPAVDLTVTGAPPSREPIDPLHVAFMIARVLFAAAVLWVAVRLVGPRVSAAVTALRVAWKNSEYYAHRQVLAAINAKNVTAILGALEIWSGFYPANGHTAVSEVDMALGRIGAARFGPAATQESERDWLIARSVYIQARKRLRSAKRSQSAKQALPPLNP